MLWWVRWLFGLICVRGSAGQITAVQLGSRKGLCAVPTQEIRVLPEEFNRNLTEPFTSTSGASQIEQLAGCQFLSFDPAFDALLGTNRTFYQLGLNSTFNYAFEGPVYLPETDEVYFAPAYTSPGELNRISLVTGEVTPVPLQSSVGVANGATNYRGQVALTTFGELIEEGIPPGVLLLDPYNGTWSWLINNWFGLKFGGPDDIVALNDGTLIFTDTGYADVLGFSPGPPQVELSVYILPPTGPARVLISELPGTGTPNGVALSPDQQILYVSTTPLNLLSVTLEEVLTAHSIYAYDLTPRSEGVFAENMRTFCSVDVGFPDGFKVDSAGNVWTSSGDGIQVFSPAGSLLGKIIIPDASIPPGSQQVLNQIVFAGDRLVIMHHSNVLMLPVNITGAALA